MIIYDILGREVTTLVNEQLKPGSYEVARPAGLCNVSGDPIVPGIYGSFANHYSLLRTLEDAFGISTHLGGAASASTLGNIWAP